VSEQRRGLGRGLASLIPGGGNIGPEEITELPVAAITPNPDQPRTMIAQDAIDELADSIGKVGMLQPIIVRPFRSFQRRLPDHRR